jgi:hypothetical protein
MTARAAARCCGLSPVTAACSVHSALCRARRSKRVAARHAAAQGHALNGAALGRSTSSDPAWPGVLRSWERAAIIRVRSSMNRLNLPCIRLKTSMMACISRGPRVGMAIAVPVTPARSTTSASVERGVTSRLAARMDTRIPSSIAAATHATRLVWAKRAATGSNGDGSCIRLIKTSHRSSDRAASISPLSS